MRGKQPVVYLLTTSEQSSCARKLPVLLPPWHLQSRIFLTRLRPGTSLEGLTVVRRVYPAANGNRTRALVRAVGTELSSRCFIASEAASTF